jgi:hypothetical protein
MRQNAETAFLARYDKRAMDDHLTKIKRAARSRDRRRAAFDDADAELRRLIREGFGLGISGEELATAAGLSVPRVYQIRDGRR